MDSFAQADLLRIDLVYAAADHPENIFQTALYRKDAKFWLHRDLAIIVLEAARIVRERWQGTLVLKDGLRTTDAQAAMQETPIVKANPEWCAEGPDRLLSPPGCGGHPRGMAVDVAVLHQDGTAWDMGTPFDFLTTDPSCNPAARDFRDFPEAVLHNRAALERAFVDAAHRHRREILPLPSEWWDFRLPGDYTGRFAPLSDHDLPPEMRIIAGF